MDAELSNMKNYQYESQCQVNPVVLKLGTICPQCSQLGSLKWEVQNAIQAINFSGIFCSFHFLGSFLPL